MHIDDGAGKGFRAQVDSKNRLDVHAEDESRREAIDSGKAWSLSFDKIDPAGSDDYFAYIKNTGSVTYVITDLRVWSTVKGTVEVHKVTGTAAHAAVVAMSVVSRNLGSAVTPNVTANADTNTTGLTNEGVLEHIFVAADDLVEMRLRSGIVLAPGTAIALFWDTATGILQGTFTMYEHPEGAT